jgi:hypothetical protein
VIFLGVSSPERRRRWRQSKSDGKKQPPDDAGDAAADARAATSGHDCLSNLSPALAGNELPSSKRIAGGRESLSGDVLREKIVE